MGAVVMAKKSEKSAPSAEESDSLDAAVAEAEAMLADGEGSNLRCPRGLNAMLRDVSQAEGTTIPQLLYEMLRSPLKARYVANYERITFQRRKRQEREGPGS